MPSPCSAETGINVLDAERIKVSVNQVFLLAARVDLIDNERNGLTEFPQHLR